MHSLMLVETVSDSLDYLRRVILISTVSWRSPMEQSGLLEFSLEFFLDVSASPNPIGDLLRPALRLIGNSCADNGGL